ncbi:MAG: hypothetical protein OXG35_25555 [Acidobacteria bacterium]|nr:hypothetical protein [Acidobacteriota bacterium]
MTATTTTATTPRPTLEELVDRIIDAVFGDDTPTPPHTSLARGIHDARRLRRSGDLDAALAVFAGFDSEGATDSEAHWAYAEFLDLAKRRFQSEDALVYSPGPGRAAVLTPQADETLEVRAVLGMRWRTGKVVSQRSLRGLKPLAKDGSP